jgi:hypothetical protein
MTIAIGQNQERGLFDLVDDWLKRDRFYSLAGLVYYYFQRLI